MRYNEGLPIFLGVPKFNRTDSRDSREDHKDCNFLSNCRTEFLDRIHLHSKSEDFHDGWKAYETGILTRPVVELLLLSRSSTPRSEREKKNQAPSPEPDVGSASDRALSDLVDSG